MTAVCVMVLGTTSGAGKSWVTTALCRYYARQGLKVAPFKAQNMSNNARVVAPTLHRSRGSLPPEGADAPWGGPAAHRVVDGGSWARGGEIGSAQYFQALAANAEPDVRMNPLLLKPEADTRSQVVLMGQVSTELSALPWRSRSEKVWPHITAALDALREENDVVVIEGAGSPAEINLHSSDVVNMRVARHAQARCLLVTDIDRGGAFAHLYGTWALLPEDERSLIKGFVLNKFRGDASLLAPAPQQLQALTGVPVVATLPMWWQHGLPEEDGVFDDKTKASGAVNKTIAVIAWPRISNLDEFQPLKNVPGVRLVWARTPADCAGADWIVLPGSKSTASDLAWLRAQGLDRAVAEHAARGGAVLGICGGLQVLGEALIDTHGIDGNAPGLGLLPLVTAFEADKTVRRTTATFGDLHGAWRALSGVAASGYEIHHGQTAQHPAMAAKGDIASEVIPGLAWQNAAGNVLGCYLHGLFEDAAVLRALFGAAAPTLDSVFDGLADFLARHVEPGLLERLIETDAPRQSRETAIDANRRFTAGEQAAVHALFQLRRDMRHFAPGTTVPTDTLERLHRALLAGPSVGLMQPLRVLRITDAALRAQLVQAVDAERLRTADALGERGTAFMALKVEGLRECAELWAVVLAPDDGTVFGRRTLPQEMALCSAGAAVQNLWLAARAEHLGLGWVSLFSPPDLCALLQLPPGAQPLGLLCIGPVERFYDRPMLQEQGWREPRPADALLGENTWNPAWSSAAPCPVPKD